MSRRRTDQGAKPAPVRVDRTAPDGVRSPFSDHKAVISQRLTCFNPGRVAAIPAFPSVNLDGPPFVGEHQLMSSGPSPIIGESPPMIGELPQQTCYDSRTACCPSGMVPALSKMRLRLAGMGFSTLGGQRGQGQRVQGVKGPRGRVFESLGPLIPRPLGPFGPVSPVESSWWGPLPSGRSTLGAANEQRRARDEEIKSTGRRRP